MSWWTHIRGAIEVSVPGRTQPEIQYILDTVLAHLPLVTGSEGSMKVHAVKEDGYNCTSNCDEFGNRTNLAVDVYGCHSRRYGMFDTQDSYILVLEGDLRDRVFEQTKREFIKWLCRLSKRLWVMDVMVRVWGYCNERLIINEHMGQFYMMSESFAYDEQPWWKYLMWERDPLSSLPLLHASKYFNDQYVNEEIERRVRWRERCEDANESTE